MSRPDFIERILNAEEKTVSPEMHPEFFQRLIEITSHILQEDGADMLCEDWENEVNTGYEGDQAALEEMQKAGEHCEALLEQQAYLKHEATSIHNLAYIARIMHDHGKEDAALDAERKAELAVEEIESPVNDSINQLKQAIKQVSRRAHALIAVAAQAPERQEECVNRLTAMGEIAFNFLCHEIKERYFGQGGIDMLREMEARTLGARHAGRDRH